MSAIEPIKNGRPINKEDNEQNRARREKRHAREEREREAKAKRLADKARQQEERTKRREARSQEARIEAGFVVSEDRADPNKKARTEATARAVGPLWQDPIKTCSTSSKTCEDVSLAERLLSGQGREQTIPVYDLLRKYPDTRLRRRVTNTSVAPTPLVGVQVFSDGNVNPASLPSGVVLESEEDVTKEHRVSAYPLATDADDNEIPVEAYPTCEWKGGKENRRTTSTADWSDVDLDRLARGDQIVSTARGPSQPKGTSRGPTIADIKKSAKDRLPCEKMVEIPPFIQVNAFAKYNPNYVHQVENFVLFQEYEHRMDPLGNPTGKSRLPGYWAAPARRGLLAMLVPRKRAYTEWYHKMTDVLGCPIVVDATGETALLTLKAPSFVCMGHQKLKVDFDHCHATIGLDPRHGADAKVFHDGVWAGQAEDHVDLVANMVGTSDEAVLRRTLAIKEVQFYDSEVLDWLTGLRTTHSEVDDLIRVGKTAHDGAVAGLRNPAYRKYVSLLCPSRANFSGDTPIPHFDPKDAPMSFSAGLSTGDYEWLEVRQYEMGIRYWAPPNSLMLLRSNRQIHSTHLWGANRNRFTTVMFYHSKLAVASFGMFRRQRENVA